jgi:uncharacterized protein YodC (DUF2158 family)
LTWKKADEVRLKSSGPNMTVLDVSDDGVRCWWFDKNKLHKEVFPAEMLIEAPPSGVTNTITVVHLEDVNEKGERVVWLEPPVVDRLTAMRGPSESYSDVILRLVELEAKRA